MIVVEQARHKFQKACNGVMSTRGRRVNVFVTGFVVCFVLSCFVNSFGWGWREV